MPALCETSANGATFKNHMTPAARVQAAIDVVAKWQDSDEGLDRVLAGWARTNRYAGSKDRAAIADHVYGAVRRMRSAGWVAGADDPAPRDVLRGHLILDGIDPAEIFTGQKYAPATLSPEEATQRPLKDAPRAIRLDYPDRMAPLAVSVPDEVLEALRHRAPLDLRVNTLKTDVKAAIAALATEAIQAAPHPLASTALRVADGARKVSNSRAYQNGLVEIQDAASQAVAEIAEASPGETVLDLCAGGGGKTLALAAKMKNQGRLLAYDFSQKRLAQLPPRANRAGAMISTITQKDLSGLQGACDLVLVDAPCSGSGAWRRNPDAKWRLTQEDLNALTQTQQKLLAQAQQLTTKGGRIAYVTCSLFDQENLDIVKAFEQSQDRFQMSQSRQFTTLDGADGFYVAILRSA